MKALIKDNNIIIFNEIPSYWNKIEGYQYSTEEELKKDGWKDVVYPYYNPEEQNLGTMYYDEIHDIVTYNVLSKTEDVIQSEKLLKIKYLQDSLLKKIQMKQTIDFIQSFDDIKAETNKDVYPLWEEGISVIAGEKYQHFNNNGDIVLWKVITSHITQSDWPPKNNASLWTRIGYDGEILDWVQPTGSHDAYNIGDRVKYNGFIYESTVNSNVYPPNLVVGQWTKL